MSCFDVQILDPNINTIEIETCIGDQPSSIDIVTYDNISTVEINHCVALLPSELDELIAVKDILSGSGISVTNNSGIYTISLLDPTISATGILDLLETVQDIIGNNGLLGSNYISINYDDNTGFTTISATGLQPSGNYSVVGHSHTIGDITNFADGVSGLLPSITGSGYIIASFANNIYTISVSGLQPSGNYSVVGHNHTSSDITDFNTAVSGLLPVKNISAGSGIGITSTSGDFTVSVTGTFGLTSEEVDDRINSLLVPGNYVNLNYNDLGNSLTVSVTGLQPSGNYSLVGHTHTSSDITNFNTAVSGLIPVKDIIAGTDINITSNSGIYTINSSNTIASDTLEPDGFVNRTDSIISFNDGSRQFSIAPKAPATTYVIYNNGVKVVKNTTETTTLPDTTALYFIHFDKSTNNLSHKTTGFNFDTDIPIAHIYYNADDNKAVYFGEERHGIRMDASTHRYLHNVFGTQYINGLSISNYSTSGNGSSNSDATIAIGDGLIYDEDIEANITHSNTPNDPFEQILNPIAQIPVYYKVGSNGAWTNTTANNYPVKTGTTVQYNLNSAGIWSASDSTNPTNNRYIAYWICATTQENAPIISIMGQRIDSSLEQATSNNAWGDLNLTGLPIVELRPLYRLIYDTKSTFSNTPKGFLVAVLDIRSHIDTVTGLTQNDHGNLYGLADDDHYQYVHIDNARTIDAIHNFRNGLGINTSTPSGALHIVNDDIACYIGDYSTWTNGGKVRVFLDDDDNQNQGIKAFISKVGTSGTFYYGINGTSYTINGGGSGTNVGLYGFAGNGARNWGLWVNSGDAIFDDKVGIGTVSPSGKLDVVGNTNINGLLTATSGNFSSLTVNSTGVSLVGHTHASSNITDFSEAVQDVIGASGFLIPGTGINISYNDGANILTISTTGLQPSGNYSTIGHTHTSSNITDFNSSVSGLLPSVTGSGYVVSSFTNNSYTISVSGLQPSGNYSLIGHTHTSSEITDLNAAISGIVENIVITNNGIIPINNNNTTSLSIPSGYVVGSLSLYQNGVKLLDGIDYIATNSSTVTLLYSATSGSYIEYVTPVINNNVQNLINASITGLQPSGNYSVVGHTHTTSDITNISTIYDTSIYNLGTISGTVPIDYSTDRMIQTFSINNNPITLTKGTGWPTSYISRDVLLQITCINPASITWNIVGSNWYNQPAVSLPSGEYMVLLRAMGSGVIQGHYIGQKQGSL